MVVRRSKAGTAALDALRAELGGRLPDEITSIDEDRAARLVELIQSARARQQAHIEQALQSALSHLPALLRGPVRKLFDA